MDIKLKNFGKIKDAYIKLSGLTLIAGPNDSGKSTVGKSLFAIIKSIANYPDYFNQINNAYLYTEYLNPLRWEFRESSNSFFIPFSGIIRKNTILGMESNSDKEDFISLLKSIFTEKMLNADNNTKINILNNLIEVLQQDKSIKNKDKIGEALKKAIEFLKKNNTPKEKIRLIVNRILRDVFDGNINNSVHKDDIAKLAYTIDSENILSISMKKNVAEVEAFDEQMPSFRDATFIDNPLLLECIYNRYNERIRLFDENDAFVKRISILEDLIEKKKKAEVKVNVESYYEDLFVDFKSVFNKAQFKYSDSRLKYTVNEDANELEISNIASGSKSFGLLYILLKSGILTKDSLIIFDEPENHLHPEWQLKYAEIICKMVRNGFYVLLTSHSPYMIQALRTYSEKEGFFDERVNFYFAEKDKEENYCNIVNVRDKNGNFDDSKIFKSLYSPIEELEKLDLEYALKSEEEYFKD